MTIKELKIAIANLPDNMDVMIEQTSDESLYGMAQKAEVRSVILKGDDIPKKEWAKVDCLVISDEF